MKSCEKCRFLEKAYYEDDYYECELFGCEPPECFQNKNGEGCKLKYNEVEKLLELSDVVKFGCYYDIEAFVEKRLLNEKELKEEKKYKKIYKKYENYRSHLENKYKEIT